MIATDKRTSLSIWSIRGEEKSFARLRSSKKSGQKATFSYFNIHAANKRKKQLEPTL
jgi:hypothetical protein